MIKLALTVETPTYQTLENDPKCVQIIKKEKYLFSQIT